MQLGSYLGLKNRGGDVPSVEIAGPAESCLFLLVPHRLSISKPNSAAEIAAKLCTQFSILSKSENNEGCVVILHNLKDGGSATVQSQLKKVQIQSKGLVASHCVRLSDLS